MNKNMLKFLLVVLIASLTACSSESNKSTQQSNEKSAQGITLPSAIQTANLPNTGTLTAHIYVDNDGSGTPAASQNVEVTATEVNFNLTLPAGTHTITIIYEFSDATFGGPFELARATSGTINFEAGSNQQLTFRDSDYSYADSDGDGLYNVTELDDAMRTHPGSSICVLDSSLLDSCTLG